MYYIIERNFLHQNKKKTKTSESLTYPIAAQTASLQLA